MPVTFMDNSAFHPSGVGQVPACLAVVKVRAWGVFTCVGWKATLRDPIWQVTSYSCEMELN